MATATVPTKAYVDAELDNAFVDAAFDGSGHLILTTRDATEIDAGAPTLSIPDASTTVKGIVELATTAETEAGSDTVRAVTPAGLDATLTSNVPGKVPVASTTVQGKVELATEAEVVTGTDTARASTPAGVAAAIAAVAASSITPRPLGIIARRTRTTNSTATNSATGQGVIKLSCSVISGRAYKICSNQLHLTSGASDEVAARVFITTNGVDPTTSDTLLCDVPITIANAGRYSIVVVNQLYVATSSVTLKATLFVARKAGTAGSSSIAANDGNIVFWIEDMGVPVADAGSGADI